MQLEYHRDDELPRLAWCATVSVGGHVRVEHGPWVETRPDCFFEGAWNGDYRDGRLDLAHTVVGTGARVVGGRLVVAPANDDSFYVYTARIGDQLIVSNSLVFAMTRAGTAPDIGYPYYLYDFYALVRLGLRPGRRSLRTKAGRPVTAHMYRRVAVSDDLGVRPIDGPRPPRPHDFHGHVETLTETMAAVFENATHPDRAHPFQPLMAISKGYDSSALCAIAAGLGQREAVTFTTDGMGYDDRGHENAAILGLDATILGQLDYLDLPGHPEDEFFASNPTAAGVPVAGHGPVLEGRMLVKGDAGDWIWSLHEIDRAARMRWMQSRDMSSASMNEFRLRTGTQVYDAAGVGAVHCLPLHHISHSDEMAPWRIGGDYDRPIPRRIAESAGLPREAFGQEKMFGLNRTELTPETVEDFRRFYASAAVPDWFRNTRRYLNTGTLVAPVTRVHDLMKNNPRMARLYKATMPTLMRLTRHRAADWRRRNSILYFFHWGFERTRHRYEP